jgi:hypothetical protein
MAAATLSIDARNVKTDVVLVNQPSRRITLRGVLLEFVEQAFYIGTK